MNVKVKYLYGPAEAITSADPTIKLPSDLVIGRAGVVDLGIELTLPEDTLVLLESISPMEYSLSPSVIDTDGRVTVRIENFLNDKLIRYTGDAIAKIYVIQKQKAVFIKEKQ